MDALLSMVGLSDGCMNNEYGNAQKNIGEEDAADQGSSNESTGSNKSRDEFAITADEAPSDVIASLSTLINDAHTSSSYGGHTVEPWRQRHPLRRYQEPTLSKMIWPCDCNSEMKIIRERAARVEENMDNLFTQITQIFQHINPPETSRVPSLQSRFQRDPSNHLQVPLPRLGSSLDVKVCKSCRKVFATEGALMAHRDVCKESNLPTPTEKQPYNPYAKVEFTCFCGIIFYTEANYKVHSSFCDTFRTHKLELKEHNKGNGLCEFCGTIVFGGPTVMRVHWSRCRDKKAKEKLHIAPAMVTLSSSDEEKEEIVLDSDSDASIVEVTSQRCDNAKLGENSSATIRDDLARIRREFLQTNKERSSTSSDPDHAFRSIDSREPSVDGDRETVEIEGQEAAPSSSHPHLECERDWNGERESGDQDQDEESDCWTRTRSDAHESNKEGNEENPTGDDDDDTLCADLEQIQKQRLERAMRKLDGTFSQFNSNLVAKGVLCDTTTRRTRSSVNLKTGSLLQRLKGKRKSNDISSQQNREKREEDDVDGASSAAPVLSPEVDDDLPPVLSDEEPCRDQVAEVEDSDSKAKTDTKRARRSAPVEVAVTSSTLDLDSIPDGDPRIDDATFVLMHPTEDRLLSAEETVNFLCRDILNKIRLVSKYVSRALIRLKGMSWMQLCEDTTIDSALLQLRISGYTKKEDDRDVFKLGIADIL